MATDNIIQFPNANSPLLAGSTVTYNLPLNYRHHNHIFEYTAQTPAGASIEAIRDIVETLEFFVNGRAVRHPLTVDQYRYLQNTYEPNNYAGNRPGVLVVNWREWQKDWEGNQDEFSMATGGVVSFVVKVKFRPGIVAINDERCFIVCDDGLTAGPNKEPVKMALSGVRHFEKFTVQNSKAATFTYREFDMSAGAIKRITLEDGGKIDRVRVIVNKVPRWDLTREKMRALLIDLMGLQEADAATATRFTLPFDYMNRGVSGLGMVNADGSGISFELELTTNATGGFDGIFERYAVPGYNSLAA